MDWRRFASALSCVVYGGSGDLQVSGHEQIESMITYLDKLICAHVHAGFDIRKINVRRVYTTNKPVYIDCAVNADIGSEVVSKSRRRIGNGREFGPIVHRDFVHIEVRMHWLVVLLLGIDSEVS